MSTRESDLKKQLADLESLKSRVTKLELMSNKHVEKISSCTKDVMELQKCLKQKALETTSFSMVDDPNKFPYYPFTGSMKNEQWEKIKEKVVDELNKHEKIKNNNIHLVLQTTREGKKYIGIKDPDEMIESVRVLSFSLGGEVERIGSTYKIDEDQLKGICWYFKKVGWEEGIDSNFKKQTFKVQIEIKQSEEVCAEFEIFRDECNWKNAQNQPTQWSR